jgi:hypothetical protein
MGFGHCGFEILVIMQLLHGADIVSHFKQMRGKAVAKGIRADRLMDLEFLGLG